MRQVVIVATVGTLFFIGLQLGGHLIAQFIGVPLAAAGSTPATPTGIGGPGL